MPWGESPGVAGLSLVGLWHDDHGWTQRGSCGVRHHGYFCGLWRLYADLASCLSAVNLTSNVGWNRVAAFCQFQGGLIEYRIVGEDHPAVFVRMEEHLPLSVRPRVLLIQTIKCRLIGAYVQCR